MTETEQGTCLAIAGDVRVCVPNDTRLMTPYVLQEQGDWFEDEIKFLRTALQPGNHVVDIGANYGVYTLMAAKSVGAEGRVWAFEPSHRTAAWLRQSVTENRFENVELIEAAISNRVGNGSLLVDRNSELNRLGTQSQSENTESVELVTLDRVASTLGWPQIDFMKIDAEGHEIQVIEGGREFLSRMTPLIMCEIKASDEFDFRPASSLLELGYESYRIVPGLGVLAPLDLRQPVDGFQLNIFCCKRDRAEHLAAENKLVLRNLESGHNADGDWPLFFGQFAYATSLIDNWKQKIQSTSTDDMVEYQHALSAYAQSRSPDLSAATRLSALQASYSVLAQLVAENGNFPRLLTFVRVASDLGYRQQAIKVLDLILKSIRGDGAIFAGEPFLAPTQEFESIDPGSKIGNWIVSAVLTAYERLRAYSSYFSKERTIFLVTKAKELGFCTPEMQRRLDLVQRFFQTDRAQ